MKRYISLVLVALMVLGLVPGGSFANKESFDPLLVQALTLEGDNDLGSFTTPDTFITPDWYYVQLEMNRELNNLKAGGKKSNLLIDYTQLDLSLIESGSVTSHTYTGDSETLSVNTFQVSPISKSSAADKITRYVFHLTNQYRPDTAISINFSLPGLEESNIYTYGTLKHEAMLAIVSGIPECLEKPRLGDSGSSGSGGGGSSWTEKYTPETMTKEMFTSFKIGVTSYTTSDGITKTMDVAPEVKGNKTFVPIRYLAKSLGVADDGITWDSKTQTVAITRGETVVSMTIGDTTQLINDNPVEMDVAPYIKSGRTMLPARWLAEPLGATVEWDEVTQQNTIKFTQEIEQTQ